VPPSHVVDTYSVEIPEDDEEYLGLNSPQDAFILNIVTFSPNQSMTVNLKGPIVVNRHSFTAKQIVPRNAAVLPTSFPLNN
jgi:flagellar assembly factor FliW